MSKQENTKYPNIYKYKTQKGMRYRVRFKYTLNGRNEEFYRSGLPSLAHAKSVLAEAESKVFEGLSPNIPATKEKEYTFNEYYQKLRDFMIDSNKWNKNTQNVNDDRFKVLSEYFGDMKLKNITREKYQRWINKQYKEQDYSQSTMEGFDRLLMQIINDAVEEEHLDRNRLKKRNLTKEGYKPKDKIITLKEYKEVMKTAKKILEPAHYTMLYLSTFGLRRGEVNGIRKNAIELLEYNGKVLAKVYIGTSRTRNYPNGNKPKTEKSDRFIFVNEVAATLLQDQINRAKIIKAQHNQILNENDFIFLNPKTAKPYYVEIMNDQLKKIRKVTGINIFPHMLRHMFATAANLADVDAKTLRSFMGHSNADMTAHYTHPTEEAAIKLMNQTNSILHHPF